MLLSKNFKSELFDSPDKPGSGQLMDKKLIIILQAVRSKIKREVVVTSGFRSFKHNLKVGGKVNSPHLRGFAIDVYKPDSHFAFEFIRYSILFGITRIGIGKSFIHIDNDPSLPQNVIWYY